MHPHIIRVGNAYVNMAMMVDAAVLPHGDLILRLVASTADNWLYTLTFKGDDAGIVRAWLDAELGREPGEGGDL